MTRFGELLADIGIGSIIVITSMYLVIRRYKRKFAHARVTSRTRA